MRELRGVRADKALRVTFSPVTDPTRPHSAPILSALEITSRTAGNRVIEREIIDVVQPDIMYLGGLSRTLRVCRMAEAAGLVFEGRSEVNANPRDNHDHEFGVWTLPPSLRACRDIEDEAEKAACTDTYRAIGESDRMTLKFRKPE